MSISVNGGWSMRRRNSAGLPTGSSVPESIASLCAATVACSPSGSTPAARATSARVLPRAAPVSISAADWARWNHNVWVSNCRRACDISAASASIQPLLP